VKSLVRLVKVVILLILNYILRNPLKLFGILPTIYSSTLLYKILKNKKESIKTYVVNEIKWSESSVVNLLQIVQLKSYINTYQLLDLYLNYKTKERPKNKLLSIFRLLKLLLVRILLCAPIVILELLWEYLLIKNKSLSFNEILYLKYESLISKTKKLKIVTYDNSIFLNGGGSGVIYSHARNLMFVVANRFKSDLSVKLSTNKTSTIYKGRILKEGEGGTSNTSLKSKGEIKKVKGSADHYISDLKDLTKVGGGNPMTKLFTSEDYLHDEIKKGMTTDLYKSYTSNIDNAEIKDGINVPSQIKFLGKSARFDKDITSGFSVKSYGNLDVGSLREIGSVSSRQQSIERSKFELKASEILKHSYVSNTQI